jgi:hypothetical protein
MIKIRADMNALTIDRSRIQLGGDLPSELEQGMRTLLYEPGDFEVEATIEKDTTSYGIEIWYGLVDWDTYRDLPDMDSI